MIREPRTARRQTSVQPHVSRKLVVGCYACMLVIVALDWATSAGVVVGLLLSVPIVFLSLLDRPRPVIVATGVALLGFAVAAAFGQAAVSPPSVWVPNRVLAVLGISASGALALLLQRHRVTAESALDAALSARDTSRLLMSLMAHDLRAPLVAATQALEYVERSTASGAPLDAELVADTRLRLRRNLRVIELVLQVARGDMRQSESAERAAQPRVRIAEEIAREAASFVGEAEACGKHIVVSVDAVANVEMGFDGLVLRQVLAILLDNAIRHARRGPVSVDAQLVAGRMTVSVTDSGPGLSARTSGGSASEGSGIGLELCRALAARVGGSLELEQDSEYGTRFCLHLPFASDFDATVNTTGVAGGPVGRYRLANRGVEAAQRVG
jgi:signal transduction histidine kinase